MRKALFIVGPTASGKTDIAFNLAPQLTGRIISADSRQVYQDLDVISGKDIPESAKFYKEVSSDLGYFDYRNIKIYGLDLVSPENSFNVSTYLFSFIPLIDTVSSQGTLPIVVGGTGFYIKGLVDGIETSGIPENKKLRQELNIKTVEELKKILEKKDKQKFLSMNNSDRNNPRRLVRAIEIAMSELKDKNSLKLQDLDALIIGLYGSREIMQKRINSRVKKRIKLGAFNEAEGLFRKYSELSDQVKTAIGYRQLFEYFKGEITKDQAIEQWRNAEINLVKKQMTWFRKDKRVNWFDISEDNYQDKISDLVFSWYNKDK